jgi:hypothetical protein
MPIRSNFSSKSKFPFCSLCNEPIELKTAKTDESGKPVHEECYVMAVRLRATQRPPPGDDGEHHEKSIPQAIVSFLDSASLSPDLKCCPVCGSELEFRNCTFVYRGQTWETRLPICFDCRPTKRAH